MIEFINIQNFKTLLNNSFGLGSLNVFSGLNGMGKSTLVQSLLLLRQSFERNTLKNNGLLLNGDYVNIGTGKDALSNHSDEEKIVFIVKWSELEEITHFEFDYLPDSDLLPQSTSVNADDFSSLSLFNTHFQYLGAERLGPQNQYGMSDFNVRVLKSLGCRGEYTAHFIAVHGAKDLEIQALVHPKAKSLSLLANVEAWMSDITPGLKIKAVAHPQYNSVSLSYAFNQGLETTEDLKPQNVGFGLSYVLPVVTSILSANRGDLLIIENPESHLHPAGQALMGRLCAIAASNGVQLIVESHSDHFLNSIRVAVKKKVIMPNEVKLFFLQRNIHRPTHASEVLSPNIDENGRINCWPDGFFDQWDKELYELL